MKQTPKLDLRGLGLDSLPASISELTHLRSIYLNWNLLNDKLHFIAFRPLVNLEELFLYETNDPQLTEMQRDLNAWCREVRGTEEYKGRISASFTIIGNYLDPKPDLIVADCGLTSLPNCLGMLTHLRGLNLNTNPFPVFPEALRQLTGLTKLCFYSARFETIPSWIAELRNLESFSINYSNLNALPDEIANLQNLRYLGLENNQITEIPRALARLGATEIPRALARLGAYPLFLCRINTERNRLTLQAIQAFQAAITQVNRDRGNPHLGPIFEFSIYEPPRPIQAGAQQALPQTLEANISSYLSELQVAFPKADNAAFWVNRPDARFPQAGNPNAHLAFYQPLLTHENSNYLMTFLTKLRATKDYKEAATKTNVLVRVDRMLEGASTNEAFRDQLFICLGDANNTCGDRVALYFNQIEILWRIYCSGEALTIDGFKDLMVGRWRIIKLEEIAYQKIAEKGLGDYIETILIYQVRLKDVLNLPVSNEGMLYEGVAGITPDELEEASESVLATTTKSEDVIKILLEQESWKNRERMEESPWFTKIKAEHQAEFDLITDELNEQMYALFEQKDNMTDQEFRIRIAEVQATLKTRTEARIAELTRQFVLQ